MNDTILITYTTRYGSTREVAEAVASTLREHGLMVDLRPMSEVGSLDDYRALILGAPIYFGGLHGEFERFVTARQDALMHRPVAVFALGPILDPIDQPEWDGARDTLDEEIARFPWLAAVDVVLFGGKYDPSGLGLRDRLIASLPASPLRGLPASDLRDWPAIHSWADEMASALAPAASMAAP